jgi:hypothetical protein
VGVTIGKRGGDPRQGGGEIGGPRIRQPGEDFVAIGSRENAVGVLDRQWLKTDALTSQPDRLHRVH